MERVTCRDEHGRLLMNDGPMTRGDACTILLERCAAYEDTELTPEEVQQLAQAKADGRLVLLPTESEETIRMVETALGIELYDWQKAYILGQTDYMPPGRHTGKTTAHMIRLCLSKGNPIEGYQNIPVDGYHGTQYQDWYVRHLEDIYFKLQKQHPWLKLRVIKFYRSSRPQPRGDLMNGHREIRYSSYGDAAAGVKEPKHE